MGLSPKALVRAMARRLVKNRALTSIVAAGLRAKSRLRLRRETRPIIVVLSLGAGGHSYSAARAARWLGYRVLLVSPRPVLHEMAFAHYLLPRDPLTEVPQIIADLRPLQVAAVTISIKHILLPAQAQIAEALGLTSVGAEVGILCNDKYLWRQALDAAGLPQPRFSLDYADLAHGPAIQKPRTGTGSKGVAFLEPGSDVPDSWDPKGDLSVGSEIYFEAYHEGEQYDVEGVSRNGEHRIIAITKEKYQRIGQLFPPRYFLFNPDLDAERDHLLRAGTFRVLDASAVRNGAWHVESRVVDGRLMPIDFANRMGYERFMTRASGVDFARQHVSAFLPDHHEPFRLQPRKLIQFFATSDADAAIVRDIAKNWPGNVVDGVFKPFFMGTMTYDAMIVVSCPDDDEFWKMIADIPLDPGDRPGEG
jgi:carbamoylphosphate synthase large subunit